MQEDLKPEGYQHMTRLTDQHLLDSHSCGQVLQVPGVKELRFL